MIKIALIYVAPGQEDQTSILQNQQGSSAYHKFVDALGWTIDVATHAGYRGKLDVDGSNGDFATYYCTDTLEMLFHDITRMPTDLNDSKQLKKVQIAYANVETPYW